ncbi:MAG: hypothetical protein ACRDRZ_00290 [Pseudonocardiaceae bacterium]
MADFNFEQYVVPVQQVDSDASGGDGGESGALAFGYAESEGGDALNLGDAGDGGDASGGDGTGVGVGGDGGASEAKSDDGGDAFSFDLIDFFGGDTEGGDSKADSEGGDGGAGVGVGAGGDGGEANGGDVDNEAGDSAAVNETSAESSADGGDGGNSYVDADQDVTVENNFRFEDSFNEDNDVTVIKDSFNEDNDGVENDGTIEHSVVAGDDINDSFNSDDDVKVEDSYNKDNSETDVDITTIEDSFNKEDNDVLDLDLLKNVEVDIL